MVRVSESSPPSIVMTSVASTAPSLTNILSAPASVLITSPSPSPELTLTISAPSPKFRVSAPAPTVISSTWLLPVTVTPSSFRVMVFFDAVDPDKSSVVSPLISVAVISPVVAAAIV